MLIHNALSLVHAGKLTKPVSASAKGDVYIISQALDDVLKSPWTAEHSFVAQEPRKATPLVVKCLLDRALQLIDPAKRTKIRNDVPVYDEISHTPVSMH